MTAMLMELSAAAPLGVPIAAAIAMTLASATARRLKVGLGNLTNQDLVWSGVTRRPSWGPT
jgi:hypothetical protein